MFIEHLQPRRPAPAAAVGSLLEGAIVDVIDAPVTLHLPRWTVVVELDDLARRAPRGWDGAALPVADGHAPGAEDRTSDATGEAVEEDTAVRVREERARRIAEQRAEAAAAALAMALPEDLGSSWVAALDAIPAEATEPLDVLAALQQAERAARMAEARRLALVVALVGPSTSGGSSAERHKAREIAIALGMSDASAETLIHRARLLAGPFECFGAALAEGDVSFAHCLALIASTASISDPDVLAEIAEAALPHTSKPVSRFRTQVEAIILAVDTDACRRRAAARADRCVYTRRDKDGMSFLGVKHQTAVIEALYAQIRADGDALLDARTADRAVADTALDAEAAADDVDLDTAARGAALEDGDLRPDACRADALAARVLGRRLDDGSVEWDPASTAVITVEIVTDLLTLLGLRDGVALVNGEPAPACTARELARIATWWRRMATDPVTGVLLDRGDLQYLPEPVRRFVFARDGGCRAPTCTRRHSRYLEMDHATEFPRGPSSSGNCGALCRACHRDKTLRLFELAHSQPDGSAELTTVWGQTVRIGARPYLPQVPEPAPPAEPLDQPPF